MNYKFKVPAVKFILLKKLCAEFKQDREILEGYLHNGLLKSVITLDTINKVYDGTLEGSLLKVNEIVKAVVTIVERLYSFQRIRYEKTVCKMDAAFIDN